MQSGPDAGGRCLSEDTVLAALDHALSPSQRSRVDKHLAACDRCRELILALEGTTSSPPLPEISRYQIESRIGSGGVGVVYAAVDSRLERKVALKLLRPDLELLCPGMGERLVREAKAMAKLSHPNVVTVFDSGSVDQVFFVAMELVEGTTLADWLHEEPRPWPIVVDRFLQAGRGLAAAHRAGLLHRDFKPQNVLLDREGRARVTDFGLARPLRGVLREPSSVPISSPSVDETVSETGNAAGTPAYMSPEQFAGRPLDERSDQFSFCVSLYQGLCGHQPFPGATPAEIAEAIERSEASASALVGRAPRPVRRALLRGLRRDPQERFSSMDALLRALAGHRRRPMVAVAVASILVLAGTAAFAFLGSAREPSKCDARRRLSGVWDQTRRSQLRDAMLASGTPHADEQWARVEQGLDRYAESWSAMYVDTCQAARTQEDGRELLDVRRQCLGSRLSRLQWLAVTLAQPDPAVAQHAVEAVLDLPPVERCSTAEMVEARIPSPSDPETGTEVERIRQEVVRAESLRLAGKYLEAVRLLRDLRTRAEQTKYRPVLAEVLYYLGVAQSDGVGPALAEATLKEAAHAGQAGRHDQIAAEAWIHLTIVAAQDLGDTEKAHEYARHAQAAIDRIGGASWLEAEYTHHMGVVYFSEGRFREAEKWFRRAAQLLETTHSPWARLHALEGLGLVTEELGNPEEALKIHKEVLEARRKALGDDHPDLALSYNNVATSLYVMGRAQEALGYLQRSLALKEQALGPDHVDLAVALHNLGEMLRELGRYQEALGYLRRAQAIFVKAHGSRHQHVATVIEHQAGALIGLEENEKAAELLGKACQIFRETVGSSHPDTARCLVNLGEGLRLVGRYRESLTAERQALAIIDRTMGPESLYASVALTETGRTLLAAQKPRQALVALERAAALFEDLDFDPALKAPAWFALARALGALGRDRDRALELARRAQGVFEQRVPARAKELAQVKAWLDDAARTR